MKELTLTTCPACGKLQKTDEKFRLKKCEDCESLYDYDLFSKVIKMDDFVYDALTTTTGG